MLAELKSLSDAIKRKREQIWDVEARALALEDELVRHGIQMQEEPMLDFNRKLGGSVYLEATLEVKIRQLPTSNLAKKRLREEAHSLSDVYKVLTSELSKAITEWQNFNESLIRTSLSEVRRRIFDESDIRERISANEVDAKVIIKLALASLDAALKENHEEMKVFLGCVKEVYTAIDEVLSGSRVALARFLMHPQSFMSKYSALHGIASDCQIPPRRNIQKYLHEFSVLVGELHRRMTDALPPFVKDNDGHLLPCAFTYLGDDTDRDLFLYMSPRINKVGFTSHGQFLADVLLKKLAEMEDRAALIATNKSDGKHTLFWQAAKKASALTLTQEQKDSLTPAARRGIDAAARVFVFRR